MRALVPLALCACLSAPVRPAGDSVDAAVFDAPLTSGDSGPGAPDAAPAVDAGILSEFPSGVAVLINPLVGRLNGDALDDVILAQASSGAEGGLYVLYGRESGFLGGYDELLSTAPMEPVATALADVLGGPELDLLVLGRPASEFDDGRVLVFEGKPGGGFKPYIFRATPDYHPRGGFLDSPEPIFITTARISGRTKADLVFGDLYSVFTVAPAAWTQQDLQNATMLELPRPGGAPWTAVNGAVAAPSAVAGRDDLFLLQNQAAHWFFHHEAFDGYDSAKMATFPLTEDGRRSYSFTDVDGNGLLDVATLHDAVLSFLLVSRDGAADPTTTSRTFEKPLDLGDGIADAWVITQLDDDPRPDLVVLDDVPGNANFGLRVYGNLYDNGAGLIVGDPRESPAVVVPPGNANRLIVGDFDGDGEKEIRVFGSRLVDRLCFVPRSNGPGNMFTLGACPGG